MKIICNMKKLCTILLALCLLCPVMTAQNTDAMQLNKQARKVAKSWIKGGWNVKGDLPLDNQLALVWKKSAELDEAGMPRFITVQSEAVADNYNEARIAAMELAKMRIASSISENVEALVESELKNDQINLDGNQSKESFMARSKSKAIQKLGGVVPAVECWRECADKSVEVRVIVLYDTDQLEMVVDVL